MKTFREYLAEAKIEKEVINEERIIKLSSIKSKVKDIKTEYPDLYKILEEIDVINVLDSFEIDEKRFSGESDELDFTQNDMSKLIKIKNKIRLMGGSKPRTIRILIDL